MGDKNDKIIKQFVDNLKKDFKLQKVILFGSRSKGDYLIDSDYDLIIVSEDFKGLNFLKRISLMYKYWSSDIALETLCYTPEEFERKRNQISIVKVAVEEGIEIAV